MRLTSTVIFAGAALISFASAATFTNPLKNPNGSDPFIVYSGGYYYLLTTTWTNVQITRATTLGGLKTGETKVVWSDTTASRCCNVWAPEVHWIDNKWYIYYTAGQSADLTLQQSHVLKGAFSVLSWLVFVLLTLIRRCHPMGHIYVCCTTG